ncbi:beta galactosidase jelly roll domain-containing protein [Mucilaginibacter daejeonensis]|uniref:sialate O-acetylesterase n=1 Tax=Mucilaginibacter daejeonensis TaxID=398049 RepID=UPI001D170B16|nr:sialate O-acetylesterase [Mucilaginibacter daejeonensis]UEG54830.1 beta galactosidase jelly roll domain-containing protein [Mucilaginibacter daejeonensis]
MSPLFGDGMVLQRNKPITIWGWADRGEKVTVKFQKQTRTAIANKDGKWRVILNSEPEGGPYQMTIKGKDQLLLSDVLLGEVWLCSGQSNMEFAVRSANNASREILEANNTQIRQFKVPNTISKQPQDGLTGGSWRPATPENVGEFTAVGYFYAKELYKQLKVPIGLINSTWGGTDIETWISRPALENSDIFRSMANVLPPAADLDVVIKARKEQLLATIEKLQSGLPKDTAEISKWREPKFDDTKWPEMPVPAFWEGTVDGLDGTVWLRRTFNISKKNAGKLAELHLGMVDDEDVSYLNGVKVGGMKEGYNTQRVYPITAGLLKEGANTIAIRVQDNGGGGGVTGKPDDIQLLVGEDTIGLAGQWKFQVASLSQATNNNADPNVFPSLLYNGMISPLVDHSVKGVLWYQGENNAQRAVQYRTALPLLINDWRKSWKQPDMPFYIIQISSWKASGGDSRLGSQWAELREAQTMASKLPNTGLVVTVDVGETNDIHPKDKQDVGKRSAALSLARSYGMALPYQGPSYKSMQIKNGKAMLTFSDAEDGLWVKDKYGYIKGFELAGANERFYYAKATLDGNKVILENPNVSVPVAVRYAWADDAGDANLYNKAGFPLVPFRTDDWKTVTANMKYTIK